MKLTVREIQLSDINLLADYWLNSDDQYMIAMGVDLNKLPQREQLVAMLSEQLELPYDKKNSYCIIWQLDDKAVGHSNVNKIKFGEEAFMHLHLWNAEVRQKGYGTEFVKNTTPYFFKNLKLKNIFCEPYALNPSPNKTLEKAGFKLVKNYITIPGSLNFEQPVNQWVLENKIAKLLSKKLHNLLKKKTFR